MHTLPWCSMCSANFCLLIVLNISNKMGRADYLTKILELVNQERSYHAKHLYDTTTKFFYGLVVALLLIISAIYTETIHQCIYSGPLIIKAGLTSLVILGIALLIIGIHKHIRESWIVELR